MYFSFAGVMRFITNRKLRSFVFTRSECQLTIITLIQWIKIDDLLLIINRLGTVHSSTQANVVWTIFLFSCCLWLHYFSQISMPCNSSVCLKLRNNDKKTHKCTYKNVGVWMGNIWAVYTQNLRSASCNAPQCMYTNLAKNAFSRCMKY